MEQVVIFDTEWEISLLVQQWIMEGDDEKPVEWSKVHVVSGNTLKPQFYLKEKRFHVFERTVVERSSVFLVVLRFFRSITVTGKLSEIAARAGAKIS